MITDGGFLKSHCILKQDVFDFMLFPKNNKKN